MTGLLLASCCKAGSGTPNSVEVLGDTFMQSIWVAEADCPGGRSYSSTESFAPRYKWFDFDLLSVSSKGGQMMWTLRFCSVFVRQTRSGGPGSSWLTSAMVGTHQASIVKSQLKPL